jgi:hypothetical protein
VKNRGIGLCHTEFFGDKDEINQAVDSEEFEFRVLHLCWSVRHDPDRASCLGIGTEHGVPHRREDCFSLWKQAQAVKSVFAIPIGCGLCRVDIGDAESSE